MAFLEPTAERVEFERRLDQYGVSLQRFQEDAFLLLTAKDVYTGLLKALVFGAITVTVCCQQGISTEGGAAGVGRSTTRAVVITLTMILISDYLLTRFVV